jgi:hypothetical protein
MDKNKTSDIPVETTHGDDMPKKVEKSNKPTHRYYCDACTGIAFYHVEGETLPGYVTCRSCGISIGKFKETNLIKL